MNVVGGLDAYLVPNGNQNQNPHCNPRPRRMGDDFKLTAISKLPKFDGKTEGHKCPITFKIQTESAWEFINGLATPQGRLTDDVCEARGRAMVQQLSGDPLSWFESYQENPGLQTTGIHSGNPLSLSGTLQHWGEDMTIGYISGMQLRHNSSRHIRSLSFGLKVWGSIWTKGMPKFWI